MTARDSTRASLGHGLPWGVVIGSVVYGYFYGWQTIDPRSIDWLAKGDLATSFLGWHFFRHEPWSFPLALVRNYGEGLGATIVLTDSIPLLALALKPFSGWLPGQFQYFGAWVLACYVLNATFAFALVAHFTESRMARAVGAILVTMAPFLTWRGIWHLSLVANWLLFCALWLYLVRPGRPHLKWTLLLLGTVLTNPYLFGVVGVVWIAWVVAELGEARASSPKHGARTLALALGTAVAVVASSYVVGMFSAAGYAGSPGAYGRAPLDLLSWIDSRGSGRINPGYQRGLPDGGEGFVYLGLGAALCIFIGAVLWLQSPRRPDRRLAVLIGAMAALVAFAVSHRVHFGGLLLVEFPLPEVADKAGSIFRSSARFGWLPGYFLLIASVALIANRMPPRVAAGVLVFALVAGHVDWRANQPSIRDALVSRPVAGKEAQAALVASLPPGYRHLVFVPQHYLWSDNIRTVWGFALAAAERGMGMNLAYLARHDARGFEALRARIEDAMDNGRLDPGTLYVTRNAAYVQRLAQAGAQAARYLEAGGHLAILPAPGPAGTPALAGAAAPGALPAPAQVEIEFGSSGDGRYYMRSGWTIPAEWGTWSQGPSATLFMPAVASSRRGSPARLRALAQAYFHSGPQVVEVRVGGRVVATWTFATRESRWMEASLPESDVPYLLEFRIANPQRPSEAPDGASSDSRLLGIALTRLRVE